MATAGGTSSWTAIVPVKPLSGAKSRLTEPGVPVADLALAFLDDVLVAVTAAEHVGEAIVVSADPTVRDAAQGRGARAVDDTGHSGINAAARWAMTTTSGAGGVLVVVADLACLTADSLENVLAAAAPHPAAFVADVEGTGTTMWLATDVAADGPHFGPGSRAAHRDHGAFDLAAAVAGASGPWLRARLDVDTPADLDRARALGLGPAATRLLVDLPEPQPATILRIEGDVVVLVDEGGRTFRRPRVAFTEAGWLRTPLGQRVLVVDDRIWPPA